MSNNNEKDDNLTVSRVYETLKSPTFLKNLYWDILSGIKEKVTNSLLSYFLCQILFVILQIYIIYLYFICNLHFHEI